MKVVFVKSIHIDKKHVHNHIIFNSTTLDCAHKFDNFRGSTFAVRRLSDLICAEYGLSVIENPKPSLGRNYGKWLGDKKSSSHKDILKQKIDEIIPSCATFEEFLKALKSDGFTVNEKRKHITVTAPDWIKPSRLDTLKGNYTEAAIRERLGSVKIITASGDSGIKIRGSEQVNFLINIQSKIQEGKGKGVLRYRGCKSLHHYKTQVAQAFAAHERTVTLTLKGAKLHGNPISARQRLLTALHRVLRPAGRAPTRTLRHDAQELPADRKTRAVCLTVAHRATLPIMP